MGDRVTCQNCGFPNEPGDEFCGQCGRYLGWPDDAGRASPPTADTPAAPIPGPPTPSTPAPPPTPSAWSGSYLQPSQPPPGPQGPPPVPQGPPASMVPPPMMGGVSCRTCGLVNPPGRTFCQRCGNELDPAVGTVAGTPRPVAGTSASGGGGGRRLVAAGLGLVVVAVVVGAAIVFGGVLGGPAPTATPRTAIGSPSPAIPSAAITPTSAEPTSEPTSEPTVLPTGERTPRPTARPTRRPTTAPTTAPTEPPDATDTPTGAPVPTVGGPTPPPPGTFVCDRTTAIADPLSQGWRVQRVDWSGEGDHDQLTVTLNRFDPLAGDATQAIVHVLPVADVAETLKVVAPSAGRDAVALGLWEGVRSNLELDQALGLSKLRWITMGRDDNGFLWLVLGVRGAACYSLQVPAWTSEEPGGASTVQVIVDVEH